MSWEKVKLGELYTVHNGLSKGRQFFGSGFPFLTFSTVFNNWFVPNELDSLVQSNDKERESCSIQRGDVFITRTSETMNELGMSCVALKDYPNATYNGFTKRMRPLTDRVIPEYIGYYLRSHKFRAKFMAFSSMTTRASLANDDLLSMEVELPAKDTQEKIASMLSRYDALIANYRQQIKLLEEAAQRIYKEWFVDMRFPGHENTPFGEDGLPEGWRSATIHDVANVNACNLAKDSELSVIDYVDLGSVREGTIESITRYKRGEEPGRARRIANDGDIIWGMVRPNLKSFALVQDPKETMIFSTGFAVITPTKVPFTYLYEHVITDEFVGYLVNCTNGAAYPAVKPCHFEDASILIPSDSILNAYHQLAEPIMREKYRLEQQISLLTEARDRLLPRLMSGEIAV